MRICCTVCVKSFEMKEDYCFNLHTGLKCQRESGQIHSSLFIEVCWPLRICIICLVFPGRSGAFPSDAHPFSLHLLNCNGIFKFKKWCYTLGGEETISCGGHCSSDEWGNTPLRYTALCYMVTNIVLCILVFTQCTIWVINWYFLKQQGLTSLRFHKCNGKSLEFLPLFDITDRDLHTRLYIIYLGGSNQQRD